MKLDTTFCKYMRNQRNEVHFQNELVAKYRPRHPTKDQIWCPILSKWVNDEGLEGVHSFDSMHGDDAINTIFGNYLWCSDLYSARNSLLIHHRITEVLIRAISSLILIVQSNQLFARKLGEYVGSPWNISYNHRSSLESARRENLAVCNRYHLARLGRETTEVQFISSSQHSILFFTTVCSFCVEFANIRVCLPLYWMKSLIRTYETPGFVYPKKNASYIREGAWAWL
jgi:hypothetical protein